MARRQFLAQLLGLPLLSFGSQTEEPKKKTLKIMMKSAWGSDDPTRASFPFLDSRSPMPATRCKFFLPEKPPI